VRRLRQNPYHRRLEVRITHLDPETVRGELPSVAAEACAGHFAQYPALPLSGLVEVFSNVGGALLRKRLAAPELGYRLQSADIATSRLVFAGQALSIHGRVLIDTHSPTHAPAFGVRMRLHAHASDGEEVASMTAVLTPELADVARG